MKKKVLVRLGVAATLFGIAVSTSGCVGILADAVSGVAV